MDEGLPITKETSVGKRMLAGGVILLAVFMAGIIYHFHQPASGDSQKATAQEAQDLVAVIGKLIILPTDETPVVATVADPTKLKDQPFFIDAKKGDKVLIYNSAHKAVLYDPVARRIVNVATLNVGGRPSPSPTR